MKRILLALAFLCLTTTAHAGEDFRIAMDPLSTMIGLSGVVAEYRITEGVSLGYEIDNITLNGTSNDSSFTFTLPFARYYFSGYEDSFYLGAGMVGLDVETTGSNPGTSTASGTSFEIGYQWRWDMFDQELGYESWDVGNLTLSSGETVDMGSFSGLVYNIGIHF